jgi:hypothetical protein
VNRWLCSPRARARGYTRTAVAPSLTVTEMSAGSAPRRALSRIISAAARAASRRAALGLVGWSQAELAERSGLSIPTIQRMENPQFGPLRSSGANLEKIRKAFASAGVTFSDGAGKECVCFQTTGEQQ